MNGPMHFAIVEALDAMASPEIRQSMLELALKWSRLETIPERGPEVSEFLRGPLFLAVEETLGAEAASAVRDELLPMAELVSDREITEVRRSAPPMPRSLADAPILVVETESPTGHGQMLTAPAPGAALPRVLFASANPTEVQRLSLGLSGVAIVEPVSDAVDLLEGAASATLVVIDCRQPTISVETLVAMTPELPEETQVVIWSEPDSLHERVGHLGESLPETWTVCEITQNPREMVELCELLLL